MEGQDHLRHEGARHIKEVPVVFLAQVNCLLLTFGGYQLVFFIFLFISFRINYRESLYNCVDLPRFRDPIDINYVSVARISNVSSKIPFEASLFLFCFLYTRSKDWKMCPPEHIKIH